MRLHHELDARRERDEFVRPCPDRVLLETIVADLLDVFLRHDPAGAAGVRIEGQKVRPRFLQPEADMPLVGDLHRRDPFFQQGVGGAAVALERELHVLGRYRVAVVELDPGSDHEIIGEAVLRRRRTTSARLGVAMLPGIGFTMPSCSAYSTMKGVMMPGVSAGSNQVGASDTWIAQVSWPCGPPAKASRGAAAAAAPQCSTRKNVAARDARAVAHGDGNPRLRTRGSHSPAPCGSFGGALHSR